MSHPDKPYRYEEISPTVEMSIRKGARAEPLIFSISQSNSQFPQSKIKSTKRSTPVLNFSKYETVLKK